MPTPVLIEKPEDGIKAMPGSIEPVVGGVFSFNEAPSKTLPKNFAPYITEARRLARAHFKDNPNARALTEIGDIHFIKEEYSAARKAYLSAVQKDAGYLPAYRKLVNTSIVLGDVDRADKHYHKLLVLTNDDTQITHDYALFKLATAKRRASSIHEAEKLLQKLIQREPSNALFVNSLGVAKLTHQKNDEAKAQFEKALSLDARLVHALNNLGICFLHEGKIDRAISQFQQAMNADPNYPTAYENIASALIHEKRFEEAKTVLLEAEAKRVPISELWQHKVGWLYIMLNDLPRATRWYEQKLTKEPRNDYVLNNLGFCYQKMGDIEKAAAYYGRSIAIAYTKQQIDRVAKTIAYDVRSLLAFNNLARIELSKKNYQKAAALADEILKLDPSNADGLYIKGAIAFHQNKFDSAKNNFKAAIKNGNEQNLIDAYSSLSYTLIEADKDYEGAIKVILEALARKIHHPVLFNNYAYAAIKGGDIKLAKTVLAQTDSNHPFLTATKGLLEFAQGNIEKGNKLYQKAIDLLPEESRVEASRKWKYELANTYANQGELDKALDELEAIKSDDGNLLSRQITAQYVDIRDQEKSASTSK